MAALAKAVTNAMIGHSHLNRLEVCPAINLVLRARVLPLVESGAEWLRLHKIALRSPADAERVWRDGRIPAAMRQMEDAIRALTGEEVK